jgi:hypothetical protein
MFVTLVQVQGDVVSVRLWDNRQVITARCFTLQLVVLTSSPAVRLCRCLLRLDSATSLASFMPRAGLCRFGQPADTSTPPIVFAEACISQMFLQQPVTLTEMGGLTFLLSQVGLFVLLLLLLLLLLLIHTQFYSTYFAEPSNSAHTVVYNCRLFLHSFFIASCL